MESKAIAITATFVAETLEKSLAFWMDELSIPIEIKFAPYNQVFQQLLDPTSLLSNNDSGFNVILIRFEDWKKCNRGGNSEEATSVSLKDELERNFDDLIAALKSSSQQSSVPHLLFVCPSSPKMNRRTIFRRMEEKLCSELKSITGVYYVSNTELRTTYPISSYFDPHGDKIAHTPYNSSFFTALGSLISRKISCFCNQPYKVVVLDCDETLWKGTIAEDGLHGIEINHLHQALQRFMISQYKAGMLICLCSKNHEQDIIDVFELRSEMLLKRDHIISWRINWQAKSANLKSLSEELQIGLDSFIFVDDNPVECAEILTIYPEVLTLQLPENPDFIPQFLNHIWAFDHLKITWEDKQRTEFYRKNIARRTGQRESLKLADFLVGLKLEIKISPMLESQISRISQLTERTNQFNLSTIRRSIPTLRNLLLLKDMDCFVVKVRDRFGDQGLVGMMIVKKVKDALEIDTFLLSCRVLGKGVEHRMLSKLGEIARGNEISQIIMPYVPTQRNKPVLNFLESVGTQPSHLEGNAQRFVFSTEQIIDLSYIPNEGNLPSTKADSSSNMKKERGRPNKVPHSPSAMQSRIATNLYKVNQVQNEIKRARLKVRGELKNSYIPPTSPVEKYLAKAWSDILEIEPIGIRDSFFELGGDSIKGAALISRLQAEMKEALYIVALFKAPTIGKLAEYLHEHYPHAVARIFGEKVHSKRSSERESRCSESC